MILGAEKEPSTDSLDLADSRSGLVPTAAGLGWLVLEHVCLGQ